MPQDERILLIDTCGETAGVALACGEELLATEELPRGSVSAEVIEAIQRVLHTQSGWRLRKLDAIGVVVGPGSFTGVRTGLATGKGLCEATGQPLAAVSRLEVLANAAGLDDGYAALDAGRGEVYVRDISIGREWLCSASDLKRQCHGERIAVAEDRLFARFEGCNAILCPLHPFDSRAAVLRRLLVGGTDVALTDANYVRQEGDIYRKPAQAIS